MKHGSFSNAGQLGAGRFADRRGFLATAVGAMSLAGTALAAGPPKPAVADPSAPVKIPGKPLPFKISLAQWSLHKALAAKTVDPLDFAKIASTLGIDAIEYVNRFFADKVRDKAYLADLKRRAAGEGVWSSLLMIDGEGDLGKTDPTERKKAIENHKAWLDAAAFLGCHTIRVNARSDHKDDAEAAKLIADSLVALGKHGDNLGVSTIVENHGGLSSVPTWLVSVMKLADHPRVGTLPDFGNFKVKEGVESDRYAGVTAMMPFAKAVSAKSHDFDKKGNEIQIDYLRMMKIVVGAGYHGYVGIEYEGDRLPEIDGIIATKKLLERVRTRLSAVG